MLDTEEARLRAEFTECHRASLAAHAALSNAGKPQVYKSKAYQKLMEADAAARAKYEAAGAALRAYCRTEKTHAAGG